MVPPNRANFNTTMQRGIANPEATLAGCVQVVKRQEAKRVDGASHRDRSILRLQSQMPAIAAGNQIMVPLACISNELKAQAVDLLTNCPTKTPQSPKPGRNPDFYANVGKAVETLKEEIPFLFQKDLSCGWCMLCIFVSCKHHCSIRTQLVTILLQRNID